VCSRRATQTEEGAVSFWEEDKDMQTKNDIREAVVQKLRRDVQNLTEGLQRARQEVIDSPGRMQTRYDSSRTELAWVADGLAKRLDEAQRALRNMEAIRLDVPRSHVEVGALAMVADGDVPAVAHANFYMLVPNGGGMEVSVDGARITVISPESPLGRALLGASAGSVVMIRLGSEKRRLMVVDVA
jgi:transcription elongation GreA/GreB family factor